MIAIVSLQHHFGNIEGVTQATPVKAKYGRLIAREIKLLMTKATLVSISQEKYTSLTFLRKSNLGVLTTMLAA